jgi:hypothetical protein
MSNAEANLATIHKLYGCFSKVDAEGMAACYAANAKFQDPVFNLEGAQVGMMWRMLCKNAKSLQVSHRDAKTDGQNGSAHWEARYLYSATNRPVHNIIEAKYTFNAEGLIVTHHDSFNLWRWAGMALGPVGMILGWSPPLQQQIRGGAVKALAKFTAKQG